MIINILNFEIYLIYKKKPNNLYYNYDLYLLVKLIKELEKTIKKCGPFLLTYIY